MRTVRIVVSFAAAAIAALPATAAHAQTTVGDQSLAMTAAVTPNTPGNPLAPRNVQLQMGFDYESLNEGAQINEHTQTITFTLPETMLLHPAHAKVCPLSTALKRHKGDLACQAESVIGDGTATIDQRPDISSPTPATVKLFNGSDDVQPDGTPRTPAVPAVIAQIQTPDTVNTTLALDIVNGTAQKLVLTFPPPDPEKPHAVYHLQKLALRFANQAGYVTAPNFCPKAAKWAFGLGITNYDGPAVSATANAACHLLPPFPLFRRIRRIGHFGPTVKGFTFLKPLPRGTKVFVRCVKGCRHRLKATGTRTHVRIRPAFPATVRTVLEIDAAAPNYGTPRFECVRFKGSKHGVFPIFRRTGVFKFTDLNKKNHC